MTLSPARTLAVSAVCGIGLFGLAACGGGGADVRSEVSTTTVGQQLMDLKKALDAGAMSQQEYERMVIVGHNQGGLLTKLMVVELEDKVREFLPAS